MPMGIRMLMPMGIRSSHSRFPGRLTRDSQVVSLEILRSFHSRFPYSDASTSLSDADAWLSDAWFTMQTHASFTMQMQMLYDADLAFI